MAYPITDIRCIGHDTAADPQIGRDTHHHRFAAHAPKPRSKGSGSPRRSAPTTRCVLDWVTAADRMRVKGVGWEYAELLCAAGVKTVNELRFRNPQKLVEKMTGSQTPSANWCGCCPR